MKYHIYPDEGGCARAAAGYVLSARDFSRTLTSDRCTNCENNQRRRLHELRSHGHAIPIAIEDDNFVIHFEGHTVTIPLSQPEKLIRLLQARKAGALRISEKGSPTQWNIDRRTQELGAIDAFRATQLSELGL